MNLKIFYAGGMGVEIIKSKTSMKEWLNGKSAKPTLRWFKFLPLLSPRVNVKEADRPK